MLFFFVQWWWLHMCRGAQATLPEDVRVGLERGWVEDVNAEFCFTTQDEHAKDSLRIFVIGGMVLWRLSKADLQNTASCLLVS